jgi:hypothetical protein
MRAPAVFTLLSAIALALLPDAALAQFCHPGACACRPSQTVVCGWRFYKPIHRNIYICWCQNPSAGGGGVGSYGQAEIHKKNVPVTHPAPGGGMNMRSAVGARMMRRPAFGTIRRWH